MGSTRQFYRKKLGQCLQPGSDVEEEEEGGEEEGRDVEGGIYENDEDEYEEEEEQPSAIVKATPPAQSQRRMSSSPDTTWGLRQRLLLDEARLLQEQVGAEILDFSIGKHYPTVVCLGRVFGGFLAVGCWYTRNRTSL